MPEMTCTNHPDADGSVVRCSRCLRPFCNDCLVRLAGRPYCADCKAEHVLDVQSGVNTNQLELASIGQRFAAMLLDNLIIFGVFIFLCLFAVPFALAKNENVALGVFFVAIGLGMIVSLLYEPLMLARDGQTLGKKALGIRVVRNDGSAISTGQAWGRMLGRVAAGMVVSVFEYVPAFFTKERQTIHDMIAGTRVVRAA